MAILSAAALFTRKVHQPSHKLSFFLLLSFFCGLEVGAIRLKLFHTPSPLDIRRKITADPTFAALSGTILTEPQIEDRSRWVFGRYQWTEPSTSFHFAVEEAQTSAGWQPACGTIAVSINQPLRFLSAGSRLRFHCTLQPPLPPDNPGMADSRAALANQGIYLTASIPAPEAIEQLPSAPKSRLSIRLDQFRRWVFEALDAYGGQYTEYSSLPDTLLLGQRSGLDSRLQTAFRKTGLAHYISLSGMHVGILAGIFWRTGRILGLGRRPRALVCMVLLLAYALLLPPRAPTLRAIFLAEFVLLSLLLHRRCRSLNTLSLTAMVMLLFRPTELFTAGWQLSYACVLGILLFYDPIFFHLHRALLKLFSLSFLSESAALGLVQSFIESVIKLLSVGMAAWLGGAGILLYHFGSLTPLSPVWTVLLFPLVFLLLLTGFLKILLLPLLPTVAAGCSVLLDILSDGFCTATLKMSAADALSFQFGRPWLGLILLYYLWLAFARFLPAGITGKRLLIRLGVLILLLAPVGARLSRTFSSDLKLTCLSVGHGLAVVGQFPGGHTFLFDGGSITRKNPGDRIIVPYLLSQGIDSLDAVILSHGDLDHYNGLPEILSSIQVKAVYANPGLLQRAQRSRAAAAMKSILESEGLLHSSFELPNTLGTVRLSRLWPHTDALQDSALSDNNLSEVLRLEYAGRTILLCGDIEETAQRKIWERYPHLKADVLLLPHHGSGRNNLPGWIRQLQPAVRLVSCAQRRLAAVLTLDDSGINRYTPKDGAVSVIIKADGTLRTVGFHDKQTKAAQ